MTLRPIRRALLSVSDKTGLADFARGLATHGIPISCESDIYGALSEYMAVCATEVPPAILDINNSVPKDMYEENKAVIGKYALSDLWMGFHCGNTSAGCLIQPVMQYQLIMHRLMEPAFIFLHMRQRDRSPARSLTVPLLLRHQRRCIPMNR